MPRLGCRLLLESQEFQAVLVTLPPLMPPRHQGGQEARENLYQEPLHSYLHVTG